MISKSELILGLSSIWQSYKHESLLNSNINAETMVDGSELLKALKQLSHSYFRSTFSVILPTDPIHIQLSSELQKLFFQTPYPVQQCQRCGTPLDTPMLVMNEVDGLYLYCPKCLSSDKTGKGNKIECDVNTLCEVAASNIRTYLAFSLFKVFIIDNSDIFNAPLQTEKSLIQWNDLANLKSYSEQTIASLDSLLPSRYYKGQIREKLIEILTPMLQHLQTLGKQSIPDREDKIPVCKVCRREPSWYEGPYIEYIPLAETLQVRASVVYQCSNEHRWNEVLSRHIPVVCDSSNYSDSTKVSFMKNSHGKIDLFLSCRCLNRKYRDELVIFGFDEMLSRLLFHGRNEISRGTFSNAVFLEMTTLEKMVRLSQTFMSLDTVVLSLQGVKFKVSCPEPWLSI